MRPQRQPPFTHLSLEGILREASKIGIAFSRDRQLVQVFIAEPWLQIADDLAAVKRCHTQEVEEFEGRLQAWRAFGRACGIDETSLWRDTTALLREKMKGLVGCAWIRCPLFEVDDAIPTRELMRCARCQAVSSSGHKRTYSVTHSQP